MKDFYEFAAAHPWQTFFLALILGEVVIRVAHSVASIFRNGPRP